MTDRPLSSIHRASEHADGCDWHVDQYPHECTCGAATAYELARRTFAPGSARIDRGLAMYVSAPASVDDGHDYRNGREGRFGNWMQTYRGAQFWPLDPRPEEVFIEDIAHALSMACRYGGHCERFYSVAEHSVWVSYVVPAEWAIVGLLHDASEAYVADIIRPIKPSLTGYKEIEDRVWRAIAKRFRIPEVMPAEIKSADNAVLLAEGAQIMKKHPAPWCVPGEAADIKVECWSPQRAESVFRARWTELTGQWIAP